MVNHRQFYGDLGEARDSLFRSHPDISRDALAAGFLILIVAFVMREFWQPGIAGPADMLMGIYRVFELREAAANGAMYPRIGANFSFGYGSPLFQFYPPLVSYLALAFHSGTEMGLIHAAKAAFTLSHALGAIGTYVFARPIFGRRLPAFVAAAIYSLSPYLILLAYERGAAAEGLALGITPWVFWSFSKVTRRGRLVDVLMGGAWLALLVMAHNITALFVLPAALVYLVIVNARNLRHTHWLPLTGALLLGLALSAFYWLPALNEVHYTYAPVRMLDSGGGVRGLAPSWSRLVQTTLFYDYWGEVGFGIAWWQVLLVATAVLTIPLQRPSLRGPLAAFATMWAVVLIAQMEITQAIWITVPLVHFIQFSWRLLGLASLAVAVLTGGLFSLLETHPRVERMTVAVLLLAIAALISRNLDISKSVIWYDIDEEDLGYVDMFERGRDDFPLFTDYSPRNPEAREVEAFPAHPEPPSVTMTGIGYTHADLVVDSSAPFRIRLHQTFFPGWQVSVDGRRVDIFAGKSFDIVSADVPAGRHEVSIRFSQTRLRQIGDLLSLVGLALLSLGLGMALPPNARWFRLLPVLLLAGGLVIYRGPWLNASRVTVMESLTFEDNLTLLGYQLNGRVWHPGETVPLRLYWMAHGTQENYKIFLHLLKLGSEEMVAQFDSEPMLGFSPTSQWSPGEVVADRYELELGEDLPPGPYQLVMGVYRVESMQNLRVPEAPNVLPGDRVIVTQVEVSE